MRHGPEPSDALRNAFVDGELDQAEWARMAELMSRDQRLRADVCELRTLKELVRNAYGSPPPARRAVAGGRRWLAVAALCVASAGTGWLAHDMLVREEPAAELAAGNRSVLHQAGNPRIVLHVSTARQETLRTALDEVEDVLRAAHQEGRAVKVEIVANSAGLDLLRAGVSPFAERIGALRAEFPAMSLIACNQTITRLRDGGTAVSLLPGVEIAPSALDQVVKRLQAGWAYVRV